MEHLTEKQQNIHNIQHIESGVETLFNVLQYVSKDLDNLEILGDTNQQYIEMVKNNIVEIQSLLDLNLAFLGDMVSCNKSNNYEAMEDYLSVVNE